MLNAEVTRAILAAETEPQTSAKWRLVSKLKEKLALLEPRGSVARQVAAHDCFIAAAKAGDAKRVIELRHKFLALEVATVIDGGGTG